MKPHILIIEAVFYPDIAALLREGTLAYLQEHNITYEIVGVAGALEIPAVIKFAQMAGPKKYYDGFIALGCVIRGETTHYDYVCLESARGLQNLALEYGLCITNGILTVENKEQAIKRASVQHKNKGYAVAKACDELITIKRNFLS